MRDNNSGVYMPASCYTLFTFIRLSGPLSCFHKEFLLGFLGSL